jgi:hypothetical protein
MEVNHSPHVVVQCSEGETATGRKGKDTMERLNVTYTTGASLCLFDEHGQLIGTVNRPVERDPLGPGRETVYMAKAREVLECPVAA